MSRVQFNLLPDVKIDYMRTRRTKNFVIAVSTIVTIASVAILLIMLGTVEVVQKKQMSDAQKKLDNANSQLDKVSDLNKIVTVQNQLHTLVNLHQSKHASSRIFSYLAQLTPSKASISRLSMDMSQNTLSISGNADSQKTVNTFIDTLKYTTYTVGGNDSPHQAFSQVLESSFAINSTDVSYTLDMQFDPKLFANNLTDDQGKTITPKLSVPSLTTTRSILQDSSNALFQKQTSPQRGQ